MPFSDSERLSEHSSAAFLVVAHAGKERISGRFHNAPGKIDVNAVENRYGLWIYYYYYEEWGEAGVKTICLPHVHQSHIC